MCSRFVLPRSFVQAVPADLCSDTRCLCSRRAAPPRTDLPAGVAEVTKSAVCGAIMLITSFPCFYSFECNEPTALHRCCRPRAPDVPKIMVRGKVVVHIRKAHDA